VVFDLGENVEFSSSRLTNPPRLIVELRSAATLSQAPSRVLAAAAPALTTTETRTTATSIAAKTETPPLPPPKAAKMETQSMVRALGLKVGRIVLDPGHGGHDTGTSGPKGLLEKDLVLDVSKRLGAMIESRMGAEVVYTRSDDTFIPLERRTEIANEEKADLFLSIHANSSPAASSSGVETYYLNFTDDKSAMQLAARENAGSSKTVYELKDLLQRIALHEKIEESRQFAARVHHSLFTASARANSRTRDRGVRKAPFIVLIGASMPSVLAEIGFVTNPRDEALFRKEAFRQKIAEGLYQGIARYASTLSQFQVAQK
jgi:N-acetylmuramoyl-L-alanine amidase